MNAPAATPALPCPFPGLQILHADDDCVLVFKPSGLHSVPGLGADKQDSVLTRLQAHDPAIFAVHRLDRDTSGLLLFGRHRSALAQLGRQFQARSIHKRYVALVDGVMADDAGVIALPMRYDPLNKPRQIVDFDEGKPAETRWWVIRRHAGSTLVSLEPVTGRTHQLRLHLASLGHPILGDALYGDARVRAAADRLCLQATELSFAQPSSGDQLCFEQPEDFSQFAF